MSVYNANKQFRKILKACLRGPEIVTRNSKVNRATLLKAEFESTPLVTLRKTAWKSALREMEWFMSGSCNVNRLHESVRPWWRPWADSDGNVLHNYGHQFRNSYGTIQATEPARGYSSPVDQIALCINSLVNHPNSRRNVITTWNAADMEHISTPITNCHGTVIQLFVRPDTRVDMFMYQRSCDVVVGMQHNWIQYWALLLWLCRESGRAPGKFTWLGGDCHIYEEHKDLANSLLNLEWKDTSSPSPSLLLSTVPGGFLEKDFILNQEPKWLNSESAKLIV